MNDLQIEIFNILKTPQLCNFATISNEGKPWVRYVHASGDENMNIQFATCLSTRKVSQIKSNSEVHLSFGIQNITEIHKPYLQIQGHANIDTSKKTKHAFWNDMLSNIYNGPDDPDYAVVTVLPYKIELWDIIQSKPKIWENKSSIINNKEYFNKVATNWDKMRDNFFPEKVRETAFKVANVKPGKSAADIGAGTGFISEGLLKQNVQTIAVDHSIEMINEMEKKYKSLNGFTTKLGNFDSLPIDDNHVDYAFANMFLHHVESPDIAIKEMVRVVKNGGKVIITDLDKHDFKFLKEEHYDKWMGFNRDDIRKWFIDAGLSDVNINCVNANCSSSSNNSQEMADISIFIASGVKK